MAADWALVTSERQALVDLFAGLRGDQWQTPSLCPGWTVRDVLAHLTSVVDSGPRVKVTAAVRGLGRPPAVIEALTAAYADRTPAELVAAYQQGVGSHFAPPGLGWRASLTDVLVHGRDVAVPLGLDFRRPPEAWRPVLDLLTGGLPFLGSIRSGRPRVSARATDLDWSSGTGPEVTGAADDLALTLSGRRARLDALDGPGRESLARWLG